jgi:hypothetical protein
MNTKLLTPLEHEQLLSQFPKNVKLSYENLLHNKVFPNDNENNSNKDIIYSAIPKGRKAFFWFYQGQVYSLTLALSSRNIEHIRKMQECFPTPFIESFEQTIFYGTVFYLPSLKKQCISLEDVFYYKEEFIGFRVYQEKLGFINDFLTNIRSLSKYGNNNNVLWGIPILSTLHNDLLKKIVEQDKVTVYCIQQRFLKENKPILKILYTPDGKSEPKSLPSSKPEQREEEKKNTNVNTKTNTTANVNAKQNVMKMNAKPTFNNVYNIQTKQFPKKRIFYVKADLQNDIYHLYDEKDNYVDVAYIPDYKTSVMMNKLFRKIKENDNLDALEESDDEEEFEDQREDRFVDLDKKIKMECTWHPKFKHWVGGCTSPLQPPPC